MLSHYFYQIHPNLHIHAVLPGKVIVSIEDDRIYGRHIIIQHFADGYVSLYGHLSKTFVKEGDTVYAGEVIGLSGGDPHDNIGGDGMSGGAHLHFEIRPFGHIDNNLYAIDPLQYLQREFISSYQYCRT